MGIDTNPVVSPHGAIAFGDVHTLLGSQRQPPFAWVDHMGGTFLDAPLLQRPSTFILMMTVLTLVPLATCEPFA